MDKRERQKEPSEKKLVFPVDERNCYTGFPFSSLSGDRERGRAPTGCLPEKAWGGQLQPG